MAAFGEAPFSAAQTRSWLERNLEHQREHGYGLFAVCSRTDGRLIGDCGLEPMELDGDPVAELGYDFRSDHWNQGLSRLVSLIQAHNRASARVAEKTGLQRIEQFERRGRTYVRYEIENPLR